MQYLFGKIIEQRSSKTSNWSYFTYPTPTANKAKVITGENFLAKAQLTGMTHQIQNLICKTCVYQYKIQPKLYIIKNSTGKGGGGAKESDTGKLKIQLKLAFLKVPRSSISSWVLMVQLKLS